MPQFTEAEISESELLVEFPKSAASFLSAASINSNAILAESLDMAFRVSLNMHLISTVLSETELFVLPVPLPESTMPQILFKISFTLVVSWAGALSVELSER
jgi:hypothetical protein